MPHSEGCDRESRVNLTGLNLIPFSVQRLFSLGGGSANPLMWFDPAAAPRPHAASQRHTYPTHPVGAVTPCDAMGEGGLGCLTVVLPLLTALVSHSFTSPPHTSSTYHVSTEPCASHAWRVYSPPTGPSKSTLSRPRPMPARSPGPRVFERRSRSSSKSTTPRTLSKPSSAPCQVDQRARRSSSEVMVDTLYVQRVKCQAPFPRAPPGTGLSRPSPLPLLTV